MSRSANVTSIEVVRVLQQALQGFHQDARDALTMLQLEVRRAGDWLEHDRALYWAEQVRRRSDAVNEARIELDRAKLKKVGDHEPSCYEERLALEAAKRRLQAAEEKVEAVRHWRPILQHETDEFAGQLGQLVRWLDSDYPRAIAALKRMAAALENYAESHRAHSDLSAAVRDAAMAADATPGEDQTEQARTSGAGEAVVKGESP